MCQIRLGPRNAAAAVPMAPAWTPPCLRRGREFLQIDGECCGSAGCFKSPSTGQDVGLQSNHPCDGAEYSVLLVGTVCSGHGSLSSCRNCKRRRFWQHSPQRSFGHIGLECPRVRSLGLNLRIRMSCSATPLVAGELWSGSELFTCFACRAMSVGVFEQKHIQSPVHLTEAPPSQVRSFGSSSRPPLRRSSYAPRPVRVLGLESWKRGLKRPDVARRQARINAEERDAIYSATVCRSTLKALPPRFLTVGWFLSQADTDFSEESASCWQPRLQSEGCGARISGHKFSS